MSSTAPSDSGPLALKSNEGLGAWLPIETAPMAALCLVAVVDAAGEQRVFVAETSHEGGQWRWLATVGWSGWGRLHTAWTPTHWMPLPAPPLSA